MIKLAQHLSESLSATYPYRHSSSSPGMELYKFSGDTGNYNVAMFVRKGVLSVMFSSDDFHLPGRSITNPRTTSTALKVYATIGAIVSEVVPKHEIELIKFEAMYDEMMPVYKRLAERIAKQYNGSLQINGHEFRIRLPRTSL